MGGTVRTDVKRMQEHSSGRSGGNEAIGQPLAMLPASLYVIW